jgi:hypothetical protein
VAYTPELWAGLSEIAVRIEELGKKIEALLGNTEGLKAISGLCQKLLMPNVQQKEET